MWDEEYYRKFQTLQRQLEDARSANSAEIEISTLIDLGKLTVSERELKSADSYFALAAGKIRDSGKNLERLHEALGERAHILRRMKRYTDSLSVYEEAATSAMENNGQMEYAHWIGKQGAVHRLMDNLDLARQAYEKALDIFSRLGKDGLAGVADQEGNLGLLESDAGNDKAAEYAYRRALEIATAADSSGLIITWAINLGNVLSRQRSYHEAWTYYKQALETAIKSGDEDGILSAARGWASSYQHVHQWQEAADVLINAARKSSHAAQRSFLLEQAMSALRVTADWEKLRDIGNEVLTTLQENKADPARVERCRSQVDLANQNLARKIVSGPRIPELPTLLETVISHSMVEYEKSNNLQGMRDMAHLICDVNFGLQNPSETAWKEVISMSHIRFRVLGDAMKALCKDGKAMQSLELSQRIKSLSFCVPNIERMRETGAPNEEAAAYLASIDTLSKAVSTLKEKQVIEPDPLRVVSEVRAAGEMLLECGEKLRERDRILCAKLGGLIHLDDLLDALADRVAIVDLFVTSDSTILHILLRRGSSVQVIPGLVESFSGEQALALLQAWAKGNITHELSERQAQGLAEISQILHDRLICRLAHFLNQERITQIVFIPDMLTSYLPLHLSRVCGEDIKIPGIDTEGAEYLYEIYPVEYAPCLQAVAISQHQKRPRELSAVLSLSDPKSDLPGARNTSKWLSSRLPAELKHSSYAEKEATLSHLSSGIDKADIVVIGTHGVFDTARPNESHLVFHDGNWTMRDILDRPAFTNNPVFVLSACEIGASGPGAELLGYFAGGIPGALICAGAACVLASLWPVEDISMGYIVERFLVHLSYPGFRPSAALFRALRDLRRMTKEEALARFSDLLEDMKRDGTRQRLPQQYNMIYELKVLIEDFEGNYPFTSPQWWGGIVIVGSGWHLPAGAAVGIAPDLMVKSIMDIEASDDLILKGKSKEARKILERLLDYAQGADRARTLDKLAWAAWGSRRKGCEKAVMREAFDLLAEAEFLAKTQHDEHILRNINATRRKIELQGG